MRYSLWEKWLWLQPGLDMAFPWGTTTFLPSKVRVAFALGSVEDKQADLKLIVSHHLTNIVHVFFTWLWYFIRGLRLSLCCFLTYDVNHPWLENQCWYVNICVNINWKFLWTNQNMFVGIQLRSLFTMWFLCLHVFKFLFFYICKFSTHIEQQFHTLWT